MNPSLTDSSRLFVSQRATPLTFNGCTAKMMTKALEKSASCVERFTLGSGQRMIRHVSNSLILVEIIIIIIIKKTKKKQKNKIIIITIITRWAGQSPT